METEEDEESDSEPVSLGVEDTGEESALNEEDEKEQPEPKTEEIPAGEESVPEEGNTEEKSSEEQSDTEEETVVPEDTEENEASEESDEQETSDSKTAKTEVKEKTVKINVEWNCDNYNPEVEGTYTFQPSLPEGYESKEGVEPPRIKVTVSDVKELPLDEGKHTLEDGIYIVDGEMTIKGVFDIKGDVTILGKNNGTLIISENISEDIISLQENSELTLDNFTINGNNINNNDCLINNKGNCNLKNIVIQNYKIDKTQEMISNLGKITINWSKIINCVNNSIYSIIANQNSMQINNSEIINCVNNRIGKIISNGGRMEINNSKIIKCLDKEKLGHIIYNLNSSMEINSCEITDCEGYNIIDNNQAKLVMNNSKITNCSSQHIFDNSDDKNSISKEKYFKIYKCKIENCSETIIENFYGNFEMKSSEITNCNNCSYIISNSLGQEKSFEIEDSEITNCETTSDIIDNNGKGKNHKFIMKNSKIINCNSTSDIISNSMCNFEMNNSKIKNCKVKFHIINNHNENSYGSYEEAIINECEITETTFNNNYDTNECICNYGELTIKNSKIYKNNSDSIFTYCYHWPLKPFNYSDDGNGYIDSKIILGYRRTGHYELGIEKVELVNITIQSPIKNPIILEILGAEGKEGDVIAKGTKSYSLTQSDYNNITVNTYENRYRKKWDKSNNRIILVDANKAEYQVTFNIKNTDGTDAQSPELQTAESGSRIEKPDLKKDGYIVDGWYKNEECTEKWDFDNDTVIGNMTLYAKWELKDFTVTFDLNNGTGNTSETQHVKYNGKVIKPSEDKEPVWKNHNFTGWYKDKDCKTEWDFDSDTVTEDTVIYAGWELQKITVKFNLNYEGCAEPESVEIESGEKVTERTPAERDSYTFDGWYTDKDCSEGNKWNFDNPVTEDMTLYAKWELKDFTVTFDLNGGTGNAPKTQQVAYEGLVTKPDSDPTWEKHKFTGWYKDEDCKTGTEWNFDSDTVTEDTVIYAGWNPMPEKYQVIFYQYQIKEDPDVVDVVLTGSVTENNKIAEPEEPSREKYSFKGWYTDKDCTEEYNFNTLVTSDLKLINRENPEPEYDGTITLYAKWVYQCTVTFDLNGVEGTPPAPQTVESGKKITDQPSPAAQGKNFIGWYKESSCTNAWVFKNDTVTGDITLYAKWEQKYLVVYHFLYDTEPALTTTKFIDKNSRILEPGKEEIPERAGYKLTGWYTDKECTEEKKWDYNTVVTEEMVNEVGIINLYAKWTPETYKVTFDLNGGPGKAPDSQSVFNGEKAKAPDKNPEWTGHEFIGWYREENCKTQWDFANDTVTENITLYALWNPLPEIYNVIFDLNYTENGAEKTTASTVKENKAIKEPEKPVRTGYTFGGWYREKDCKNTWNFETAVTAEMVKDKTITLYAKWTKDSQPSGGGDSSTGDTETSRKGKVTVEVRQEEPAPVTRLVTADSEVISTVLTKEDSTLLENGTDIKIILEIKDVTDTVSDTDKKLIKSVSDDYRVGQYLDITLCRIAGTDRRYIHETDRKLRITLTIPERLKNQENGAKSFTIIRAHNGKAEYLPDIDNSENTITFDTDRFSTYAIMYKVPSPDGSGTGDTDTDGKKPDTKKPDTKKPDTKKPDTKNPDTKNPGNGKTGNQNNTNKNVPGRTLPGREPGTGDTGHIEFYATLIMIAGFSYLYLCFAENCRNKEEKEKMTPAAKVAAWAKQGGTIRKLAGLVLLYIMLLYHNAVHAGQEAAYAK